MILWNHSAVTRAHFNSDGIYMFRFLTIIFIDILSGVEVDLFIPSFPELQKVFNLSPFEVQLTLSVNFLAYCVCSLFAGTLGDRYNRRYVMLGSLAVFILGSVFCVFAPNFPMLLLGRLLQGVGMAGPAVLAYVLIADEYPIEKQAAMLGIYNGIFNLSVACAPVVGSYVNLYFNWRGNFVLLLALGILSAVMGYFAIPNRQHNPSVSLSLRSYWPLLTSFKLMMYVLGICFLAIGYWLFVGMAPILYMEDMGVELKYFGLYQGSIAGVFAIASILSSKILTMYGQKKCLLYGTILCLLSACTILFIALFGINKPIVITSAMLVLSVAVVFPFNILYPLSLEVLEDSKARTSALINAGRLLFVSGALSIVSYVYAGTFLPIGITIFLSVSIALCFFWVITRKGWVNLS